MSTHDPFVSILTPVYNGEKYLAECIESVLAQTYQNWEYMIVDNCSTDKTLEIAQDYALQDKRIKLICNSHFVGVIENHNRAFNLISNESKYCKVVSADDRIYPECLSKMVKLAEAHPTVGIVGSYQHSDNEVRWKGLPRNVEVISGRDVCRLTLLDNLDVFGDPTSSLYRSDLIRKNKPFFPHSLPNADTSACFKHLQYCDFGFVHDILSMERVHDGQISSEVRRRNAGTLADFEYILDYGLIYLTEEEFKALKAASFEGYYRWLGGCVLKLKGKEFWKYHVSGMRERGYPIPWKKVIKGTLDEIMDEIQHPKIAFHKLLIVLKEKYYDLLERKS